MANVAKFLDKRFELADGTYRVRIRVSHQRKSIFLSTPFSFSEKDYSKLLTGRNMNNDADMQRAKKKLAELEDKANAIVKDLDVFSFEAFKDRYEQKGDRLDLVSLLFEESTKLRVSGKFSNANIYLSASRILKRFAEVKYNKQTFPVANITPSELELFQKWAESEKPEGDKKYSTTTVSICMVRIQKIFNSLIAAGLIERSSYPFGEGKYIIPQPVNAKRPLDLEEIMALYQYEPKTTVEAFAKDMFMFSYLASGMNMADIFRLRNSDIRKDYFSFEREKTKSKKTRNKTVNVIVELTPELQDIIDRNKVYVIGSEYVFKVLNSKMSAEKKHGATSVAIAAINRSLKSIAKKIGINEDISTYYARHSFATILMGNNVPLAYISQQLNHADLKTTQNYLSKFPQQQAKQYNASLLKKSN